MSTGPRTLRWIYTNADRRFVCELSLDSGHSVYELLMTDMASRTSVERFAEAIPALLRHDQIENLLMAEGWSLDLFERRTPAFH